MVHYIRFLSTPQVAVTQKRIVTISAPVAVTTDLGDSYLMQDAELLVRVIDVKTTSLVLEQKARWQGGARALKTAVQYNGKYVGRLVCMHITTTETQRSIEAKNIPKIMDVWSHEFILNDKTRSEPKVSREIHTNFGGKLCIWEETGDSIARHVWDASLGFLLYLSLAMTDEPSPGATQLHRMLKENSPRQLKVLELGAGCGTVGLAFAQQISCDILLTDLADAMDILETNVKQVSSTTKSPVRSQILDWGAELDEIVKKQWDLVLVSDCIYNPDSSVHLVRTLQQLIAVSPGTVVVVGFKRRHAGDDVFFEQMSQEGIQVIETYNVELPHIASDADAYEPIIEFHIFRGATEEQQQTATVTAPGSED